MQQYQMGYTMEEMEEYETNQKSIQQSTCEIKDYFDEKQSLRRSQDNKLHYDKKGASNYSTSDQLKKL